MDWAKAIEINREALTRIVAGLVAMIGFNVERLPQEIYLTVERLLRPAEAAVRRLIVIAARGLVVKETPRRPMPAGLVLVSTGAGRMSFPLFDTRKVTDFAPARDAAILGGPRIHSLESFFQAHQPEAEPDTSLSATQLCRRLTLVKRALESLPRQAMRLARWKARRKKLENPKFTSPLRPGPPPGHRDRPKAEIDFVLKECHGLARDALIEDSS